MSNGGSPNQKSKASGLEKIVKNNIKKKGKLNTEELIKKFMEETHKRKKRDELNTRNLEVRKMNAKKENNQTEMEKMQELLQKMGKYKKKRSKSCMNKSDNMFLKLPIPGENKEPKEKEQKKAKRDKSNENNKTSVLSGLLEPLLSRKNQEITGRNNAVTELKMLKKEIDEEIRRERNQCKLDLLSPKELPPSSHITKRERENSKL